MATSAVARASSRSIGAYATVFPKEVKTREGRVPVLSRFVTWTLRVAPRAPNVTSPANFARGDRVNQGARAAQCRTGPLRTATTRVHAPARAMSAYGDQIFGKTRENERWRPKASFSCVYAPMKGIVGAEVR